MNNKTILTTFSEICDELSNIDISSPNIDSSSYINVAEKLLLLEVINAQEIYESDKSQINYIDLFAAKEKYHRYIAYKNNIPVRNYREIVSIINYVEVTMSKFYQIYGKGTDELIRKINDEVINICKLMAELIVNNLSS